MLEQAARALCEHEGFPWPDEPEDQEDWKRKARAVIESLREPTKEMIEAAAATPGMREVENAVIFAAAHGVRLTPGDPPLAQAWRAMIDEILQEPGDE